MFYFNDDNVLHMTLFNVVSAIRFWILLIVIFVLPSNNLFYKLGFFMG